MPETIIAGNWKMNTTVSSAEPALRKLRAGLPVDGVTSVVCPPFVSLELAMRTLSGSGIEVGAQDMRPEPAGALTGEVSAVMVAELCTYVILGHSERRQMFGESSELVNSKVLSALSHDLSPIVCVGERLSDREGGRAGEVVTEQLRASLMGVSDPSRIAVAYEPIWAIGTGLAAGAEEAQEMATAVRTELGSLFGAEGARDVPVLYGGSVNASNVSGFVDMPDINGALVGGASLEPEGFIKLTESAVPRG